jgi:hypothetical protein
MASFYSDNLHFSYATRGSGTATFLFQHGIGGSLAQPFRFLISPDDEDPDAIKGPGSCARKFRMAAFDCRAHGATPLGDPEKLRRNANVLDRTSRRRARKREYLRSTAAASGRAPGAIRRNHRGRVLRPRC